MLVSLLNILVALAMAGLVLAEQASWLTPADAFFASGAVLGVYTAYQLGGQEGVPLGNAVWRMFVEPRTHGGQTAYWSYLVSAVLAFVVIAQSVLTV